MLRRAAASSRPWCCAYVQTRAPDPLYWMRSHLMTAQSSRGRSSSQLLRIVVWRLSALWRAGASTIAGSVAAVRSSTITYSTPCVCGADRFAALAKELGVVLPISYYERANNAYYNSLAVADADGSIVGRYRKSHIPDGPGCASSRAPVQSA